MSTLNVTRGPNWHRMSEDVRASAQGGWVERCARLGFTAQGIVYSIIGYLALRLALGDGGRTTGAKGAINRVGDQPFGVFLLALLTVGLVAFVTWRWVQAFLDPEHEASHGKDRIKRVGWFISGAIYAGLAVNAVKRIVGRSSDNGDHNAQDWTAKVLGEPLGRWLIAIVGLIIAGYAVKELYSAYTTRFRRKLDLQRLTSRHSQGIVQLCRFGLAARGGVFLLMGGFLVSAAIHSDPNKAKGLGEALAILARQPFGAVLLGIAAAGLLAFALYLFLVARYQRIGSAA